PRTGREALLRARALRRAVVGESARRKAEVDRRRRPFGKRKVFGRASWPAPTAASGASAALVVGGGHLYAGQNSLSQPRRGARHYRRGRAGQVGAPGQSRKARPGFGQRRNPP